MPRPHVDRTKSQMRLPAELHERLKREAESRGLSLNEAVTKAVYAWLAWRESPSVANARRVIERRATAVAAGPGPVGDGIPAKEKLPARSGPRGGIA